MGDALMAALKSIIDENGLSRIDIGYADYASQPAYVSIWWDASEDLPRHAAEHGTNFDDAIANALASKVAKQESPAL